MPAVTVPNIVVLPRVPTPAPTARLRPVDRIVTAGHFLEGAGFPVRRPFPGRLALSVTDPFLLLDHMGAVEYGPNEAKGAPWHPHRGFETVTYIMDGELVHHDSNGGGGIITDGGTQWMTAGSGILHDELPSEQLLRTGGIFHGVQLWVNLPRALKMNPPRYQDIHGGALTLLSSADGGALLRVIAGDLGEYHGPGVTYTPITYLHASVSPGAQLGLDWNPLFNAMVYVLTGSGSVGKERRSIVEGQLALFGPGDAVVVQADKHLAGPSKEFEILLLGGQPIQEPIFHYGPFVMNTREEVITAIEDFQAGRLGQIPADHLDAHHTGSNVDIN